MPELCTHFSVEGERLICKLQAAVDKDAAVVPAHDKNGEYLMCVPGNQARHSSIFFHAATEEEAGNVVGQMQHEDCFQYSEG